MTLLARGSLPTEAEKNWVGRKCQSHTHMRNCFPSIWGDKQTVQDIDPS